MRNIELRMTHSAYQAMQLGAFRRGTSEQRKTAPTNEIALPTVPSNQEGFPNRPQRNDKHLAVRLELKLLRRTRRIDA